MHNFKRDILHILQIFCVLFLPSFLLSHAKKPSAAGTKKEKVQRLLLRNRWTSWSSIAEQIRTFFLRWVSGQSVLKTDGFGAILVIERNQHPVIVQKNGIYKNFDQRFSLLFLRNIELSKFHQPESDEILIEAGLLQFFICNFCSQLIFLVLQRFQTLFRCPSVQAVLCRIVLGGDFSDFVTRWHPMGR